MNSMAAPSAEHEKSLSYSLICIIVLLFSVFTAGCVSDISLPDVNNLFGFWDDQTIDSAPYVVIDSDPGCDDVFVYFVASKVLTEPDMYIASVGNAPRSLTEKNLALMDCYFDLKGKTALGAYETMWGLDVNYDGFNGDDALGGISGIIAESCGFNYSEYRFDYQNIDEIAYELMQHDNITYISTGPTITLAKLLTQEPELKKHIKKIVMMGGGINISNTPYGSEYNIMTDMFAVSVVIRSKIPVIIFPLDVTVPNYLSKEDIAEFKDMKSYPEMTMILEYLSSVSGDGNYHTADSENTGKTIPYPLPENAVALHDVFPLAYVHNPEMFSLTEKKISLNLMRLSYGKFIEDENGYSVYFAEDMKDPDYLKNLVLSAYAS